LNILQAGTLPERASKTVALTGANFLGELDQPTISIFTVTGEVLILVLVPFCTETLASAGGGTLALGITGSTSLFVAATTASTIAINKFWVDATPDANGIALPAALINIVVTDNVIATVATADITDGTIRFDCWYLPLSSDGLVA